MAKFKVGDRVRIVCPISDMDGREATIWRIHRAPHRRWSDNAQIEGGCRWWHTAYLVDVDGHGRRSGRFDSIGFPHWHLRPALWDSGLMQFMERIDRLAREPQPLVKEPVK